MNRHAVYFQEQEKRREILVLLKKRRMVNVQELSKHLGITKVAVRKHLDVLHRERYIESQIVRQRTGRPAYVYHLTNTAEQLFPRHYSDLAIEMVAAFRICMAKLSSINYLRSGWHGRYKIIGR